MITVVGLGVEANDLTFKGAKAIEQADVVVVKTALTPTYEYFRLNNQDAICLDNFYDEAEDFSALDDTIASFIIEKSKGKNLVYAVNGSGVDDSSVAALSNKADINIIGGVSHATAVLKNCPSTSYMAYSSYDIVEKNVFLPQKNVVLTVKEIDNQILAGDLKLKLGEVYGDEVEVFMQSGGKTKKMELCEIDRQKKYDYSTSLTILPTELLNRKRFDFSDLLEIMQKLLGEGGCPWDRAQTHQSIRINAVEEAYELVEAIDNEDIENMCEESGDLLLQAVFHSLIGEASDEFNVGDTLTMLCKKLISRHTHIFGDNNAANADEALKSWEAAKGVEKGVSSYTEKMERIPKSLPALLYCYKMQKIAVKCGFDWEDIDGTYEKLQEEIKELKEAASDEMEMEAGDVLFSAVNPLRWLKIEPELALKAACAKFLNRFRYMETKILEDGGDLSDFATREKYWAEAKKLFK